MSLAERFAGKHSTGDGCWQWRAYRNACGYGVIGTAGKKTELAHRVSWTLTFGAIPEGRMVCHRCDNPACVNPAHLFLGNQTDNMRDMASKGRSFRGTPEVREVARLKKAKLTPADVELIRLAAETLPVTQAEIALAFGVKQPQVSRILHGVCW